MCDVGSSSRAGPQTPGAQLRQSYSANIISITPALLARPLARHSLSFTSSTFTIGVTISLTLEADAQGQGSIIMCIMHPSQLSARERKVSEELS